MPPHVALRVLGSLDLLDSDGKSLHAVVVQPKRLGLLVFLVLGRPAGFHRRDELLALFWPDQSEERARNALNQALSFLRRSLGRGVLVSRGSDEVGVDLASLSCDAVEFLSAAERGDDEGAISRYVGELLPAFHVEDAPAFSDWLDQERRFLRDRAATAAEVLSTRAEADGDLPRAIDWAVRGTTVAPWDDAPARQLVMLHDRSGNPGRAVQAYDEYAARVQRALDVEPSPGLRELVGRIKSRSADAGPASSLAIDANALTSRLHAGAESRAPSAESAAEATIDRRFPASQPIFPTGGHPVPRWWKRTMVAAGIAAILVVGGVLAMRRPARPREFVVVADIETAPADSVIADMLTDETRRALSDSRLIGAAPESQVSAARRRLHILNEGRLTVELARQVALGDGMRAVVAGSLHRAGRAYTLSLRLISASTERVLATASGPLIEERELTSSLDALTRTLRARAGDDLELINAEPRLTTLTSSSLEAMSLYVAARHEPPDHAIESLQRAIALDTSFAAALWQLARRSARLTHEERRALLARAYAHRGGLTEYERLSVEASYLYSPEGVFPSRARFIERLRLIVEKYPNYYDAMSLGGWYWDRYELGPAEKALKLAIKLDSTQFGAYVRVLDVLLAQNRIREARKWIDALMRRFPGQELYEATTAYAEGRRGRVREILQEARARGDAWSGGELYLNLAWLNLLEGRVAEWERDYPPSIPRDSATARLLMLAGNYWVRGRTAESLPTLDAELAAHPEQRRNPDAAILYAQFNRPDQARSVLAAHDSAAIGELKREFDESGRQTAVGWILLAEGKPLDAVAEFRHGQMAPDGPSGAGPIAFDAEIGLAFERAGEPDSAIAAYEHYLNTPYPDRFFADGLKLGWVLQRAASLYEMAGRRDEARGAHERLVDLWKNADSELQAKVTHAEQRIAALSQPKPWWRRVGGFASPFAKAVGSSAQRAGCRDRPTQATCH